MEPDTSLSLTVRIPFSSDVVVDVPASTTVSRLLEKVQGMMPSQMQQQPSSEAQCIVYAGRLLPDSATLAEQRVVDGAVLHLMRRPSPQASSSSAPLPSGSSIHHHVHRTIPHFHYHHVHRHRHAHNHGNDDGHSHMDHDHDHDHGHEHGHEHGHGSEHAHHDHSHDHEHAHHAHGHHHHMHRHAHHYHRHGHGPNDPHNERDEGHGSSHVQANVIFGQVPADGHMGFRDAHDVLASVLQAVGFSPRAVTSASTIAAAVAVANHAATVRAPSTPALLRLAWDAVTAARPADAPSLPRPTDDESAAATADILAPALAPALREVAALVDGFRTSRLQQDPSNDSTSNDNTEAAGPADPSDDGASIHVVMTRLASVANAITATLALLSTLMPDDAYRTDGDPSGQDATPATAEVDTSSRNEEAPGAEVHIEEQTEQTDERARGTPESDTPTHQGQSEDRGAVVIPEESLRAIMNGVLTMFGGQIDGARMVNELQRDPVDDADDVGDHSEDSGHEHEHFVPTSIDDEEASDEYEEGDEDNQHHEGEGSATEPSGNARRISRKNRNADFIVRFLSYYLCSIVDVGDGERPEGPPENGQDAVSVLDGVFGTQGHAPVPAHPVLDVMYRVMQKMKPQDVHAVLGGDFRPIVAMRATVWESILKHSPLEDSDRAGSRDVERKKWVVESACESIHDFVHLVARNAGDADAVDGNNDESPNGFCGAVMPRVLGFGSEILGIMSDDDMDDESRAQALRGFVQKSVAATLASLASGLNVEWDELLRMLRSAAGLVSRDVFGSRFAIVLPFLVNLFAGRVKRFFEIELSNFSGRSSPRLQRDDDEASIVIDVSVETEVQTELISDPSSLDRSGSDTIPQAEEPTLGSQNNSSSRDCAEADIAMASDQRDDDDMLDVFLDDDELADLAMELDAEMVNADNANAADLDHLAQELNAARQTSASAPAATLSIASLTSAMGAPNRVRGGGGLAAAPGRVGLGLAAATAAAPLSNGAVSSAGTRGRASFSATPAVRRPTPPSSSRKDEFDSVLSPTDAAAWRHIVTRDQAQSVNGARAPLSRAYRSDRSMVAPLDEQRAAVMAAESARMASQAANLSEEAAHQLEAVARQSGPEYLREVENAIATRLSADPDFDPGRFVEAKRRFLASR